MFLLFVFHLNFRRTGSENTPLNFVKLSVERVDILLQVTHLFLQLRNFKLTGLIFIMQLILFHLVSVFFHFVNVFSDAGKVPGFHFLDGLELGFEGLEVC